MPTAEQVLKDAEKTLKASPYVDHPHSGKERYDAEDLLSFVLGMEPQDLDDEEEVTPAELRRFRALVARRAAGEPGAYLTRRAEFKGMWLEVGKGAFIPRQSSEDMVDQAVRRLSRRSRPVHVDVATGVGPVALGVADAIPQARVFGMDIGARPIAFAKRNARALKLSNARFLRGDLFSPLPASLWGKVDLVTVHPPYVPRGEVRLLPDEVKLHEPRESLTDDSPAGMGLLTRVVREAPGWLRPGGWLLVEVSSDRSRDVSTTLRRSGFRDVRSTRGKLGVSRVVVGRRPGASG